MHKEWWAELSHKKPMRTWLILGIESEVHTVRSKVAWPGGRGGEDPEPLAKRIVVGMEIVSTHMWVLPPNHGTLCSPGLAHRGIVWWGAHAWLLPYSLGPLSYSWEGNMRVGLSPHFTGSELPGPVPDPG